MGHPDTSQADVVIAGGGLAGMVTAYELLERGCRVLLIDKDTRENFGGLATLANSITAVRPGGLLIEVVRAEEGIGHMGPTSAPRWMGRSTLRGLAPLLLRLLARSHPAKRAGIQVL